MKRKVETEPTVNSTKATTFTAKTTFRKHIHSTTKRLPFWRR